MKYIVKYCFDANQAYQIESEFDSLEAMNEFLKQSASQFAIIKNGENPPSMINMSKVLCVLIDKKPESQEQSAEIYPDKTAAT